MVPPFGLNQFRRGEPASAYPRAWSFFDALPHRQSARYPVKR